MSPEPTNDPDTVTEPINGPGARLKAKREAGGFSLEDVSRDTRITCSRLEALEQDDYPRVGTHTFVVGYIRKYARWLNMDEGELIGAYEQAIDYQPPQDMQRESSAASQQGSQASRQSRRLPLVWLAVAILAVWLGASYLLPSDDAGDAPPVSTSTQQQPETDQPSVADEVDGDGIDADGESVDGAEFDSTDEAEPEIAARPETNGSGRGLEDATEADGAEAGPSTTQAEPSEAAPAAETPGTDAPVVEEAPIAGGEFADNATATPAAAEDTLTMSFTGDCWVEVRDANGEVVFTRLQQAGDNLRLSGEAPFAIMLGNARVADVQVNGRPVNTNPGPNRDTMRLTVGP